MFRIYYIYRKIYKSCISHFKVSSMFSLLSLANISSFLLSPNLNIVSITVSSAPVVLYPQNALVSLATSPAPIMSSPLLMVPAQNGT